MLTDALIPGTCLQIHLGPRAFTAYVTRLTSHTSRVFLIESDKNTLSGVKPSFHLSLVTRRFPQSSSQSKRCTQPRAFSSRRFCKSLTTSRENIRWDPPAQVRPVDRERARWERKDVCTGRESIRGPCTSTQLTQIRRTGLICDC